MSPLLPEWQALIAAAAAPSEAAAGLTPALLELIHTQQWFLIQTPACYAGAEWPLPKTIRLLEALSCADGSTGWTVTLCSGAGWFGGFLQPALAREVFGTERVCLAGTGAPAGTARRIKGGYLISGVWQYASGAGHATHFTANCRMEDEHGPLTDERGNPVIRPFLFLKEEVTLIPSWHSTGLTGTGSHSFAVSDLAVPEGRCFRTDTGSPAVAHTLYRYPFLPLAEATIAVNLSGMALHFIELCADLFQKKRGRVGMTAFRRAALDAALGQTAEAVDRARRRFYEAVDRSWTAYDGESPEAGEPLLQEVSAASHQLATAALRAVDSLYPYCGLSAVAPGTELNRVWRDIHTACLHPLLTFPV